MTDDMTTPSSLGFTTAGTLLREYRQAGGFDIDALAQILRVPAAKLEALEADRLHDLPDTVFARALALAVCRYLKADSAPVLALLPTQDTTRFVPKDERGLDFPLTRPSFLPRSNLVSMMHRLTPLHRLTILVVVLIAGLLLLAGLGSDIYMGLKRDNATQPPSLVLPVDPPSQFTSASEAVLPSSGSSNTGPQIVIMPVQSPALAPQGVSPTASASVHGASSAR